MRVYNHYLSSFPGMLTSCSGKALFRKLMVQLVFQYVSDDQLFLGDRHEGLSTSVEPLTRSNNLMLLVDDTRKIIILRRTEHSLSP